MIFLGLSSSLGRIISGLIPSVSKTITATIYTVAMLTLSGVVAGISGETFVMDIYGQFVFAIVFGFSSGN